MALSFSRLTLHDWQQFKSVDIHFHDRLTVLTGANASGKTTILNLLGRHAGWTVPALAVPKRSPLKGVIEFVARFFRDKSVEDDLVIGELAYSTGSNCRLAIPKGGTAEYNVELVNQQAVPSFVVPSHRSVYRYRRLDAIPVARQDKNHAFNRVWGSTRQRYQGGGEVPNSYHMKETLISWNIFGQGNQDMLPDNELAQFFDQFEEVLKKLLPKQIGFKKLSIRDLEVVLECESGDFMIDGASGGLSTIIDLAWHLFMFQTAEHTDFTVLIDEVENHLHPTMQRRLLPDLIEAFPTVQFIVSTHSPLMVTSHRESEVYILRHSNDGVRSERLDFINRAATAGEVLNDVLGVETTYPVWAEERLGAALAKFSRQGISKDSIAMLRQELEAAGLRELVPEALIRAVDRDKN